MDLVLRALNAKISRKPLHPSKAVVEFYGTEPKYLPPINDPSDAVSDIA